MVSINPVASETSKKFSPTNHVTGLFLTTERLPALLDDLQAAGFSDEDIEIFSGHEGAEELDFNGKHKGVVRRLLHDLVMALSDESQLQDQIDDALREGGIFVSVDTRGENTKKEQAIQVLEANYAEDVCYWGHLAVERF